MTGHKGYIGTVMVTVVVRELGPMVAALLVLARIGTATVIELGTARALGEVEALEALVARCRLLAVARGVQQQGSRRRRFRGETTTAPAD